jgi:hypothetical protein
MLTSELSYLSCILIHDLLFLCLRVNIVVEGLKKTSASSSGSATSLFENFGFIHYLLPFKTMLDAFCPIVYFQNS